MSSFFSTRDCVGNSHIIAVSQLASLHTYLYYVDKPLYDLEDLPGLLHDAIQETFANDHDAQVDLQVIRYQKIGEPKFHYIYYLDDKEFCLDYGLVCTNFEGVIGATRKVFK